MNEIKVLSSVDKIAKTGRPYKALEVFVDNETRKVNIFSNAPDFANIHQGSIILGTMTKDGNFWNISFEGAKPHSGAGGSFKQAQVKEVMDIKRQDIAKSQENKEVSIKIASTIRMAVDIATSLTFDEREGTMEETVRKWRQWLWSEWDNINSNTMPPF